VERPGLIVEQIVLAAFGDPSLPLSFDYLENA
jgi:hypothetical protein